MTDSEFWQLIAHIDLKTLEEGDEVAAVRPVQEALTGRSEAELEEFQEILAQKLYAIDGRAYVENAGQSGFSDDGFLYARLYVVAQGREHYEAVRADSTRMPKSIKQWCESLLYTPRYAWANLTGRDVQEWPFEPTVSYESGSNPNSR